MNNQTENKLSLIKKILIGIVLFFLFLNILNLINYLAEKKWHSVKYYRIDPQTGQQVEIENPKEFTKKTQK